jgi:uncharacterized protein YcgI (DUF1989 family)
MLRIFLHQYRCHRQVPIDPSGNFTVIDGISAPGNHVDVTAGMDALFVISDCPRVDIPQRLLRHFDPRGDSRTLRGL